MKLVLLLILSITLCSCMQPVGGPQISYLTDPQGGSGNSLSLVLSDSTANAGYARGTTVNVTILNDTDGVEWCLSETANTYPASSATCNNGNGAGVLPTTFNLSAGDGQKTVYLWVRSISGEIKEGEAEIIFLDTTPPTAPSSPSLGAVSVSYTDSPTISWIDGTDSESGVANHEIEIVNFVSSAIIETKENPTNGGMITGLDLEGAQQYFATIIVSDKAGNSAEIDTTAWRALGTPFTSVWQTTTSNESVTLPLRSTYNYDFEVDWGDGSAVQQVTAWNHANATHSYTTPGTYTITIKGLAEAWFFNYAGSKNNITSVTELGDQGWLSLQYAFAGCTNLTSFSGGTTDRVTTMANMFRGANSLSSADFSSFETTNVTDMEAMFYQASAITSLDLTEFDTSNVTDMNSMFRGATNLSSINLSTFDTSNVTNMSGMFWDASALTNLDITNFNTSSVTNMNSMFSGLNNLTSINLSNFNTANVTTMSGMFYNTTQLINLNLSSFSTANVTNMSSMFYGMNNLSNLVITSFNTSNVTDMSNMFRSASSITNLDLSHFDTSSVTSMSNMFFDISSVTTLDISNFNTTNVTDMSHMFRQASSLTSLDLTHFNTSNVTNMDSMFRFTTDLTSIDVNGWDLDPLPTGVGIVDNTNVGLTIYCNPATLGQADFFGEACN